MGKSLDLTNQRFGSLIALHRAPNKGSKTYWLCQCDCGNQKEVQTGHLTSGAIQNCNHCNDRFCLNCGVKLERGQYKYCSNKCQRSYERKEYVDQVNSGLQDGLKGKKVSDSIRTYLFEKYNSSCQKCGWNKENPITGKVPLEIHHKDGDKTNNKIDNLELLCPNCHSLTPNYKFLNSLKYKEKQL